MANEFKSFTWEFMSQSICYRIPTKIDKSREWLVSILRMKQCTRTWTRSWRKYVQNPLTWYPVESWSRTIDIGVKKLICLTDNFWNNGLVINWSGPEGLCFASLFRPRLEDLIYFELRFPGNRPSTSQQGLELQIQSRTRKVHHPRATKSHPSPANLGTSKMREVLHELQFCVKFIHSAITWKRILSATNLMNFVWGARVFHFNQDLFSASKIPYQ